MSNKDSVKAFLEALEHPLKPTILATRDVILKACPQFTETIKWNAPNFCYEGEDRITFNLQGKGFFRLIFHCGAKVRPVPLVFPLFDDPTGLLEWASNDRAILKIKDSADLLTKTPALQQIVILWIDNASKHA